MTVQQQQQQQPSSTAHHAPSSSASSASSSNAIVAKRQFRPLAEYRKALEEFSTQQRPHESLTDSSCDQPLVDEFLELIASSGHSHLPWSLIQPVVMWKLQLLFLAVMDAVHVKEAETQRDDLAKEALINDAELRDTKAFIMDKARLFDGTPFTIQRLCELLTSPHKHYHNIGTYLRALEKNINVVTTVTEKGMRITGAEEEEEQEKDAPIRVERNFIVSVDEVDEPLSVKLERQNQHEKKETIGENQNQIQRQIDEPSSDSSATEEGKQTTTANESEAEEKP